MKTAYRASMALLVCFASAVVVAAQAPVAPKKTEATPAPAPVAKAAAPAAAGVAKPGAPQGEEHHHAMSAYHKDAMEHAKDLHQDASGKGPMNKDVAKEHVDAMGKDLDAAKRHHAALEQATAGDDKMKAHHDKMHAHHDKADEHMAALKAESGKADPDPQVLKEHAAGVHHEIKQAEAEHKTMKTQRKVKDPAEPPAPKAAPKAAAPAAATTPKAAAPAAPAAPKPAATK